MLRPAQHERGRLPQPSLRRKPQSRLASASVPRAAPQSTRAAVVRRGVAALLTAGCHPPLPAQAGIHSAGCRTGTPSTPLDCGFRRNDGQSGGGVGARLLVHASTGSARTGPPPATVIAAEAAIQARCRQRATRRPTIDSRRGCAAGRGCAAHGRVSSPSSRAGGYPLSRLPHWYTVNASGLRRKPQ